MTRSNDDAIEKATAAGAPQAPERGSPMTTGFKRLAMALAVALALVMPQSVRAAGPAPVDLLSLYDFVILSGAGITSVGGGTINGNVGASPITGAAIGLTCAQVNGTIYTVDAAGPLPCRIEDATLLSTAKGDMTTAYNQARDTVPVPVGPFLNPGAGNIGGMNLEPGLYKFDATAMITGSNLTLTGGPNDVWIFQIGADLQVGTGIEIVLAGGALAKNVFWQVTSSAVIGTTAIFKGTILAATSITMGTGSTIEGRLFAFSGSVVFDGSGASVPPQNQAPVGVTDDYNTDEDVDLVVVAPGVLDNDSDADGDPITAVLVTDVLHGTLTLNPDGSFTYDPDLNYNGPDSFTYKANDGALDSEDTLVTITVDPVNDAPVAVANSITIPEDTTAFVLAPGVLGNDSDVDGDPLTADLVDDVTHGTLVLNADGSFSYTPDLHYVGIDTFTYVANDGLLDSNTVTVTITMTAVADAPVAMNDNYSTDKNVQLVVAAPGVLANDSDGDGDPLTAVLVSDVSHGTLVLNADGSFTYDPDLDYVGGDSFTYKANDGGLDSNTVTVTLEVTLVGGAPVAVDDSYDTNEDVTLIVAAPGVLGNDTDADLDPLTAILVADVTHGTLTLNANGSFTYVPDLNYFGPDSFTYKANDGDNDSNTATVWLTVNPINDAPVAVADAYSTDEDVALVVGAPGVLGNDSDVEGSPLTAALVTDVTHGVLVLSPNGSFTYTPTLNYNGPDSFTYRAYDGALYSNTVTVSITVNPINDAPVAVADAYSTDEDVVLVVAAPGVLGNDSDPDGNSLTAVLVADVTHGVLVLNANGSFTYTPTLDYNGPDSFTYKAYDGTLYSNTVTVSITVNPIPDVPMWYPCIPWTGVGGGIVWYNFQLWDALPSAPGARKVIDTNVKGTKITTAEEYFIAVNDGLLPGTYYYRVRTWVPETATYGASWLPSSNGTQFIVANYGLPMTPNDLSVVPNPGPAGNFDLTFTARNAQGYDLELTGALGPNNKVLHHIEFMPGADHIVPFNAITTRSVTLAGADTVSWRIRGFNPLGVSPWIYGPSIGVTAGVGNPVPGVPDYRYMRPEDAALVTAPNGTVNAVFHWNPVPGAAGYMIFVGTHSGTPILNYIDVGNVTRVDSINGVRIALPAGSYQWSLAAYNGASPRVYGGWNHSPQTPSTEKPLTFEVITSLTAPTIIGAVKSATANSVDITWSGVAPATVRVELFYTGAKKWLISPAQPVTVTGPNTGRVALGRSWGKAPNYLLLTGKTAGGLVGPRSSLFLIP